MEQEFQEWKSLVVTKVLLNKLKVEREELKEGLVQGNYEGQEEKIKGICWAINNLLDVSYEDLVGGYSIAK